ncbi:hypothetical protein BT67DRAFT_177075 [Trichocladium antarcticum]|uniref:Uncharacterized protein n=1 Tax=Trichocladium antarcticum TaxID=1450529 RepID=A0AAN6ZFG0_9PEZI|nr:hypothetical protein BT67DRAFT_177075 [Trichocladium antarcticum]
MTAVSRWDGRMPRRQLALSQRTGGSPPSSLASPVNLHTRAQPTGRWRSRQPYQQQRGLRGRCGGLGVDSRADTMRQQSLIDVGFSRAAASWDWKQGLPHSVPSIHAPAPSASIWHLHSVSDTRCAGFVICSLASCFVSSAVTSILPVFDFAIFSLFNALVSLAGATS